MCAFQQKQFLLPPPWELPLPGFCLCIQRAQAPPLAFKTSLWLVLSSLPTLSSYICHTFQPSLQAFTYNVTSCESSLPNPMALLQRCKSTFVLILVLPTTSGHCLSPPHRDLSVLRAHSPASLHSSLNSDHSALLESWPGNLMSNILGRAGMFETWFTSFIQSTNIHWAMHLLNPRD